MEIDLFMELPTPPGTGSTARSSVEDALATARAADRAGLGAVWLAEHHFLGDYSTSAAPDMVLAAMARETQRIGLGFAVVPLTIHDPVRVAERLATLQILSKGRAMWGVGRGVTQTELEAFGVKPAESRAVFRARFAELTRILETGCVVRDGKSLHVSPKPEHPFPAGWLAAVSPESFDLAAELGLDVMAGPFKPWPMVAADLKRYRRLRPNGKTSFTMAVYCDDDHARARKRAEDGILWVYRQIMEVSRPFLTQRMAGYEHYRTLGWIAPLLDKVLSLGALETLGLAAVGDPDHVAKRLGALKDSGLDRIGLMIGGGDLSRAETVACVERLATDVMPRLAGASIPSTAREVPA